VENGGEFGGRMAESTGRVEAFSDGVFAIAITLLILEIRVPPVGTSESLRAGLVALWPSYVAFVLSFFVILIMWVNHHELMRQVRYISYPFLFANGFVLLTVTFVPFPTAVLAEHLATGEAKAAVTFYCATFVVNALAWGLLFVTIVRDSLFRAEIDAGTIRRIRNAYIAGPLVYLVATLVALVWPLVGLALNASLWLLWVRLCYDTTREAAALRSGSA
jgi:TMEM175 potassium channel family protein